MWRIAVVLVAVGCAQPAVRKESPVVAPAPAPVITPSPEGWWIETAETMNQRDVGQALRFTPTEITIIRRGKVERVGLTITGTAPREWRAGSDDKQIALRQDGEQLFANSGKDTAQMRKATAEEARRLDAQLAAPQPPTPVDAPDVSQ